MFSGLFRMVLSLQVVAMSYVSMMPRLFVIAGLMVFSSRAMVLRGVFVVLCGFVMMINA